MCTYMCTYYDSTDLAAHHNLAAHHGLVAQHDLAAHRDLLHVLLTLKYVRQSTREAHWLVFIRENTSTQHSLFVVLLYWAFCGDIRVLCELPVDNDVDDNDDDNNDDEKSQLNPLALFRVIYSSVALAILLLKKPSK